MPFYRLRRHVVYSPRDQETHEVWGIDRPPANLETVGAPHDTDRCDPLRIRCATLLSLDGHWVTWNRFAEWLTAAEAAGYEIVSGLENLSPYSSILLKGP